MNKGFTLIELLVSLLIIGLLIVLTVPSYIYVYNSTREANYKNKVNVIKQSAIDYGETIKDEIQELSREEEPKCLDEKLSNLIKKGYIKSDYKNKDALTNPMTNQEFDDDISICYCKSNNNLRAFMATNLNYANSYSKGEEVKYNGMIYEFISSYSYKTITTDMEVNKNKEKEVRDPVTGEKRYVAADCKGYENSELYLCVEAGTQINDDFVVRNFLKKIEC